MNDWFEVNLTSGGAPSKSLLLIEESAFVCAQFKEILSQYPIHLVEARDVLQAIDLISRNNSVQAIICDINLLRMDGKALLEGVSQTRKKAIPLYLLSEENKFDHLNESDKFDAVGWINKPPVLKDLEALVQKLLET